MGNWYLLNNRHHSLGDDNNMEMMTNLLWIITLWLVISRTLRAVRIIQYQRKLQEEALADKQLNKRPLDESEKDGIQIEMVEDLICGKFVERNQAYQLSKENKTHFFCSWNCREKYIKEHLEQPE